MRDLLYFSESKMKTLAAQLPIKWYKRIGIEAGVTAGVASLKASLPGNEANPALLKLLDPVVDMIERDRGSRWRTDEELRVGDWIYFEEIFYYGEADPGEDRDEPDYMTGLVYFSAAINEEEDEPFVLVGSVAHVLDRRKPQGGREGIAGAFYIDAVREYAKRVSQSPGEAALGSVPETSGLGGRSGLAYGIWVLMREPKFDPGWSQPVLLSGHARVLALEGGVLATPLYVQYAER